jgi:hypothetical protein
MVLSVARATDVPWLGEAVLAGGCQRLPRISEDRHREPESDADRLSAAGDTA